MPLSTTSRIINDASQYLAGPKDGWKGPADLTARCYAAWTEDAMYFAIVVQDNAVVPCSGGTSAGAPCSSTSATPSPSPSMAVPPTCSGNRPPPPGLRPHHQPRGRRQSPPPPQRRSLQPLQGVTAASAVSSTGYTIELRIPLTEKNFPARQWQAGRPVKLSFLIHDSDDLQVRGPAKSPRLEREPRPQERRGHQRLGHGDPR